MGGVILSVTLSGLFSFFISARYLRKRMGLGMAIMFFVPVITCAAYIYFSAPHPALPEKLEVTQIENGASPASAEELAALQKALADNPDEMEGVLALADAYMAREDYDAAIALLEGRQADFPGEALRVHLTTAYFAKGLLFAEQGRFEDALAALRIAREKAPREAPFLPDLEHFITLIEKQLTATDGE